MFRRRGTIETGVGIGAGVVLVESVFAQNLTFDSNNVLLDDNNADRISAQGFVSGTTGDVIAVELRMHRTNAAITGDYQISIQADASTFPSEVDIAVGTFDSADLGTSTPTPFKRFTFDASVAVTATTTYHIHFRSLLDGGHGGGIAINYQNADITAGNMNYSTDGVPTWITGAFDFEYKVIGLS